MEHRYALSPTGEHVSTLYISDEEAMQRDDLAPLSAETPPEPEFGHRVFWQNGGWVQVRVMKEDFQVTVSGNIMSGVPSDTQITILGNEFTSTGDDIELVFDAPGVYTIHLSKSGYYDLEVEYTYEA